MVQAVSYGGGVQSTALLVLAAQGEYPATTFLFANVGEDSENPDTITYLRSVAAPYAAANGIDLIELEREWRDGRRQTLMQTLLKEGSRSIDIPVRMANGAPGNRNCTENYKIKVIAKWLKDHGATPEHKALLALGISLDEWQRMRNYSGFEHYDTEYPLIDRRMDRAMCHALISRAGLPVPPKSSCFYCPFHSLNQWRELKQEKPDLFQKAVDLERSLNERRHALGKDDVYLTAKMMPLDKVVGPGVQPRLFEDDAEDACESGYCMI